MPQAEAEAVLDQALDKFKVEGLCVAFNGGKDCTLALHLMLGVMGRRGVGCSKLTCLYIEDPDPFPEVEAFVEEQALDLGLDLVRIQGPAKGALRVLGELRPRVKAIVMGTRSSDPHGPGLQHFAPRDADWPPYVRVLPLLHYTYSEVWEAILRLKLPYCCLYDRGYTSLGSRASTRPSPELEGRPAHTLTEEGLERGGRV
jgi:FAD synthetase